MNEVRVGDITVVIVEDEPEIAELFESYLRDTFDVRTATSGSEGLDLVDESVDVVLLDRRMDGTSGDDVLTEIRRRGYEMPVAMLTAVEPDIDIVDLPFDEYLSKPIDQETLVRTVRILANRASFERKSREFFRIAAKKASLDSRVESGDLDDEAHEILSSRMAELRDDLDDTITDLFGEYPAGTSRIDLEQAEVEQLLTEVHDHTLPDEVRELIDDYLELRSSRPLFMWKWVHQLAPQNTLPCVDEDYTDVLPVDKTIAILFVTLLDDALEKRQDRATFTELSKIPDASQEPDLTRDAVDAEYVTFARRVWDTFVDRIQRAPNYEDYENLFRFDVKHALTAIEYSELAIRDPDLATMSDLERYESHNMVMFAYADIDLMHSPLETSDDLSVLRDAIWTAQLMARIGNWVSTWERELREGDFSSGPIVYALENDIVSRSELALATEDPDAADEIVDRFENHGVEKEFLTRWEHNYQRLRSYDADIETFGLEPFVTGTEEVLRYHLASAGLK